MSSRTPGIAAGLGHAVKAALVVAAGCQFAPHGAAEGVLPIDAPGDGADPVDAADGPAPTALCDAGDPTLILCVSFDDGMARNRAGSNIQPQTATAVESVPGRVGLGGGFDVATVLHFPEDSRLDLLQPFAFEMFVRLDQPPATTGAMRIGLLDNDSQYSLFARLRDNGEGPRIYPYCNAQATVFGTIALGLGEWHHVACVQDAGMLTIYVDGVGTAVGNSSPIEVAGNRGTTIGQDGDNNPEMVDDPTRGAIDEIRLWRGVARSSAQIQAAAARR